MLPGVRTCTTKWGFGFQAAKLRVPATVRAELSKAVGDALSAPSLPAVWTLQPPFEIQVTVTNTQIWDQCVFGPPRQERLDGRTAVLRGDDLTYLIEHIWELVQ